MILALTFGSDPFWINFYIQCEVKVQLHTFICGYLVVKASFVKRLFFPHWMGLAPLTKVSWPQTHEFIPGLSILFHYLSISISVCTYPCASTHTVLLFLCSRFCNGELSLPGLFLTRLFWLFCIPFNSIWILESASEFLQKASQGSKKYCIESVDQSRSTVILAIVSRSVNMDVFPLI